MAEKGNHEETFLLKLPVDGKEVLVSVTAEIVEALNSEDPTVRHFAYECVARTMKEDQLEQGHCSNTLDTPGAKNPKGSCSASLDTNNNITCNMNVPQSASNLEENQKNFCPSQVHIWKEDEEKLLLDLRLGKDVEFNSAKNHETLWTQITSELQENGVNVSKHQAQNKFKSLKKKYREIVDENGKTGNSTHKWKYFQLFQAAYGHKSSTTPALTFDSHAAVNEKNPVPASSKGKMSAGKRKHKNVDCVIEKIDETHTNLLKEMKEEHQQKMQRMDRFLDLFEKSVGNKSE